MIYSLKALLTRTPIQISGAVVTLLNAAIGVGWVHWDGTQVGWANTALIALLGLFVNSTTTNTAKLQEVASAATPTGPPAEGNAPPSPTVVVTAAEPVKPAKATKAKKAATKKP